MIVGGECKGDMRGDVGVQRMICSRDIEDDVVRGQIDLNHDVPGGHLVQQMKGVVFVERHRRTWPVAFEQPGWSGLADDVKAETCRRHHARRKLARMQRDVHLGIDGVEIVEHLHLQVIVAHREVAVLGHHEVDADHKRPSGLGEQPAASRCPSSVPVPRPAAEGTMEHLLPALIFTEQGEHKVV